jgi:hypothetical protein
MRSGRNRSVQLHIARKHRNRRGAKLDSLPLLRLILKAANGNHAVAGCHNAWRPVWSNIANGGNADGHWLALAGPPNSPSQP